MANTFPRVNTTITARRRANTVYIENPKVPVLLATVVSNKGPYTLTKVRSLTEFKEIFGELSYEKQGQDVLNLYQWIGSLPYNGYAWIKRIEPNFVKLNSNVATDYVEDTSILGHASGSVNNTAQTPTIMFEFKSKEPGVIYASYTIEVAQRKTSMGTYMNEFNITVRDNLNMVVSQVKGVNATNHADLLRTLDYFDVVAFPAAMPTTESNTAAINGGLVKITPIVTGVSSGITTNLKTDDIFRAIGAYYRYLAREELEDMLSYPISMILDGNYPLNLKKEIIDFVRDVRDDIHFMLTRAVYKQNTVGGATSIEMPLTLSELSEEEVTGAANTGSILSYKLPEKGNVAIWAADIARVSDPEVVGYVNVSSIYELAYKIPYNDFNYGIWWNFVGPRRGVTLGQLLHTNTIREKQKYFETKTNYIEKTNRDQCFMLQRTTGTEGTAYEQLHASRLTQYIRREVSWIGRRYLFEYNDIDATTYNECKAEIKAFLNKFASIAIDMSNPYVLDIYKTSHDAFTISLRNLKYKDIVETIDLEIDLLA